MKDLIIQDVLPKMHYLKEELFERFKSDRQITDFIQSVALDGIWYWDLENPQQEWVSEKFWETLGYDPTEKKHLRIERYNTIHPKDIALANSKVEEYVKSPIVPLDKTVRYIHKEGQTIWMKSRGIAIKNEKGKVIRLLGSLLDVSNYYHAKLETDRQSSNFESIVNNQSVYVIKIDSDGKLFFC